MIIILNQINLKQNKTRNAGNCGYHIKFFFLKLSAQWVSVHL